MLSTIKYLERINELDVECEEISQRKSPHERVAPPTSVRHSMTNPRTIGLEKVYFVLG